MDLQIINQISKKAKAESVSVVSSSSDKVIELKNIVIKNLGLKLPSNRLGLFIIDGAKNKKMLTKDSKLLRDYGLSDKTIVYVKDLGPQISWRLVYIVEYLGPLLLVAYFYFFVLGIKSSNTTQTLGFMMGTFHFGKRTLESIFVHEFSNSSMPLKNLFINCTYYWIIYGVVCNYYLFNENYVEPQSFSFLRYLCVLFFFSAEFKNLKCHLILKDLKKNNQGDKGIPHGEGFEFVSCANYFWEVLAWIFFSLFVCLGSFFMFTLFGFLIMSTWAKKKHADYLKTFPERYPKNRKAIIPFIL